MAAAWLPHSFSHICYKITIVVLSNQLNRSAYQTYKIYQAIDADTLIDAGADEE